MHAFSLSRWLLLGEWKAHWIQAVVAMIAIALGVALGFSIHLINSAAFDEFSAAIKNLSGDSDLQVRSKHATFNESLYPKLAIYDGVEHVNPVLEIDAVLTRKIEDKNNKLKILGLDMFRAAAITPDLLGTPDEDKLLDGLSNDAIFLSPAAMQWLQIKQNDTLSLNVGTQTIQLRVAGGLVRARVGQRIAVMDIAALQWHFKQMGLLSRVELKLLPGVNRQQFKEKLADNLGTQYLVTEHVEQTQRVANMSRAYRVNLNILALVALFTGAFLVFSTQALSIIRRRHQFALLRVLGFTRGQLLRQVILESVVLGAIGSALGIALGYLIATTALHFFGGDLGGGFFPGIKPSIALNPIAAITFFIIGLVVTVFGSTAPAWEAAQAEPADAIKSGSINTAILKRITIWPAVVCLTTALIFTQLPPVNGLPIFGYLAVALLLIGGIALMPRLSTWFFSFLTTCLKSVIKSAESNLILNRLANTSNQAAIALGGILASFSLMVAMAIMITSFRVSIDNWLMHILPADLYVRVASVGDQGGFLEKDQETLAALPEFSRIDFFRARPLVLNPTRPEITLIARPIDIQSPENILPMTDDFIPTEKLKKSTIPIWVSEAMVDLYDFTVGKQVTLPLGDAAQQYTVAGVWRDYGRQFGAIQMRLTDYQRLSNDMSINSTAMWLKPDVTPEQANTALWQLPFGDTLEISHSSEIRALSLAIFDRSFAVTYLLEIVAIIIGLLGVAASFSAQMLARTKEFGMLRHIGMMRSQILTILTAEGVLLSAFGVFLGFLLGWAISLILVFIVNPQSFHWTMQLHLPWQWIMIVAGIMLLSAALTAFMTARNALSGNIIQSVREDW